MRPCQVEATAGGQPVRIDVETDYPFAGTLTIAVETDKPARFPLSLRIPAWAQGAEVVVGAGSLFRRSRARSIALSRSGRGRRW